MSKESLDLEEHEFSQLIDRVTQIIINEYRVAEKSKAYNNFPQSEVENWFNEPLPFDPTDNLTLLEKVEEKIVRTATNNLGPHMYAYVMAGGNQVSTIAEFLATTLNQNPTKWHLSPAMNEIEKRVIKWTSEMVDFSENAGGVLVSGGSAANLTGLTVARNVYFEKEKIQEQGLFGKKPFTVYASSEVHSCIDKSVQILGIGTNQLRKVKTNQRYEIDVEALEKQIVEDIENGFKPFCIVGVAGTVNTGAIDDLETLADLAQQYQMWFHIDGAYGGLVASLDSYKQKFKGMSKADSIALDFHKWLYQPFEAGCAIVRDWSMLKKTYFKKAAYLETDLEQGENRLEFNEHYFQVSRNAKAFKVWMSIKSYGFRKIQEMIEKDIKLTEYLAELIEKSDDFEVATTSDLAVLCFRYTGKLKDEKQIDRLNKMLISELEKDGRVFITGTTLNDIFVLRACFINHRKTRSTTDYLLDSIRSVAEKLRHQITA